MRPISLNFEHRDFLMELATICPTKLVFIPLYFLIPAFSKNILKIFLIILKILVAYLYIHNYFIYKLILVLGQRPTTHKVW